MKMNPNEYASGGVNCKPSLAGNTIGLRNLKRLRLNNDHLDFSIDEMKTAIAKASRSKKEKHNCFEFLEMLKKLEDM